jgi:DNA polymerase III subunit chi
VLPRICERVLEGEGRLLIVADEPLLSRLDELLWSYAPDSFLPHGKARPERQPVLLSTGAEAANGARNVALADGRWRDDALAYERCFYFFDEAHLDEARSAWRRLSKADGVDPRYWKQTDAGKWVPGP